MSTFSGLLYLATKSARLRWRRGVEWTTDMGLYAIQFGERFPGTARMTLATGGKVDHRFGR